MNLPRRWLWLGGGAALLLVGLLVLAPRPKALRGSTYAADPSGYGAWYAWLSTRGVTVRRYQQSVDQLRGVEGVLVRVDPEDLSSFEEPLIEWIGAGHILVLLHFDGAVSAARFESRIATPLGALRIETRRRDPLRSSDTRVCLDGKKQRCFALGPAETLLGDRFGAVVQSRRLGRGRVIEASTPYLAANAYQDEPGNFRFLEDVVRVGRMPVLIDEYIHGYRDAEIAEGARKRNWVAYLSRTPLALIFAQAIVVFALAAWAAGRRFGPPIDLPPPSVDNSGAYVEAFAAILRKAESSEFVLEVLGRHELAAVEKALGLGPGPVATETLLAEWARVTGQPSTPLRTFLAPLADGQRLAPKELATWLAALQIVRRTLNAP
jgi:hypothetical protein